MKTVLIVDDAKFMRVTLKEILEANGYKVIGEAEDGYDAFEKYKELHPDIVTMDITMPEWDGIEGVKLIKEFDKRAQIVMISAMGQEAKVVEAIKAGARDFIVKPFDTFRILNSLSQIE